MKNKKFLAQYGSPEHLEHLAKDDYNDVSYAARLELKRLNP